MDSFLSGYKGIADLCQKAKATFFQHKGYQNLPPSPWKSKDLALFWCAVLPLELHGEEGWPR